MSRINPMNTTINPMAPRMIPASAPPDKLPDPYSEVEDGDMVSTVLSAVQVGALIVWKLDSDEHLSLIISSVSIESQRLVSK
jgi:hypothetical protein